MNTLLFGTTAEQMLFEAHFYIVSLFDLHHYSNVNNLGKTDALTDGDDTSERFNTWVIQLSDFDGGFENDLGNLNS